MELFKWLQGRQESCDYKKLCFLSFKLGKIGFDGYILRYIPSILPMHKDPIDGKMWRCNITLKGGGIFLLMKNGRLRMSLNRINIFRPDLYEHGLFIKKLTYKLSLGVAKFN